MRDTQSFVVQIVTEKEVKGKDNLTEMSENIARAIVNETNGQGIAPCESDTYVKIVYVREWYNNNYVIEHVYQESDKTEQPIEPQSKESFADRLKTLKDDVRSRFNELIKDKEYNFAVKAINASNEEDKTDMIAELEDEDFSELDEFFSETLQNLYYYERHFGEKEGYLLEANKEGLYVLNSQEGTTRYISFSDLSSVHCEINLINQMENY